jgi:hypothetical protein
MRSFISLVLPLIATKFLIVIILDILRHLLTVPRHVHLFLESFHEFIKLILSLLDSFQFKFDVNESNNLGQNVEILIQSVLEASIRILITGS